MDCVRKERFSRVGVFTYCQEDGTPAADLGEQVPEDVRLDRQARLMALQASISLARNEALVGEVFPVMVDGVSEETDLLLSLLVVFVQKVLSVTREPSAVAACSGRVVCFARSPLVLPPVALIVLPTVVLAVSWGLAPRVPRVPVPCGMANYVVMGGGFRCVL